MSKPSTLNPDVFGGLCYADVASMLAVILAVTGGVGAAVAAGLGRNTVGSPQIKNGQVKARDLGKGAVRSSQLDRSAVTGVKVEDGSPRLVDIAPVDLPRSCAARTVSPVRLGGPGSRAVVAPRCIWPHRARSLVVMPS